MPGIKSCQEAASSCQQLPGSCQEEAERAEASHHQIRVVEIRGQSVFLHLQLPVHLKRALRVGVALLGLRLQLRALLLQPLELGLGVGGVLGLSSVLSNVMMHSQLQAGTTLS